MIMLLIPRLLVAVAVMFIVTDVGVIARHRPSSSWRFKPIPYSKSRSPDFQTTYEENIYRPYEHPIPYFKSRSPDFQTTHEENIYRPYEHDLFSEIDSYVRKPSDEFNDDLDLFSGIDSYNRKPSDKNNDDSDALSRFLSFDRKPNDKNNDDSKMQKLMKPLETDHQVSTPSAPVNQKTTNGPPQSLEVTTRSAMIDGNITLVGLQQNSSEPNTTFKESHGQVLTTVPVVSSKAVHNFSIPKILNSSCATAEHQFEFRNKRLTNEVNRVTKLLNKTLEGKEYCCGAFIDIAQNFDTI